MKIVAAIIRDEFRNSKDERLSHVNIPQGLIESLNDAGFTIEIILTVDHHI